MEQNTPNNGSNQDGQKKRFFKPQSHSREIGPKTDALENFNERKSDYKRDSKQFVKSRSNRNFNESKHNLSLPRNEESRYDLSENPKDQKAKSWKPSEMGDLKNVKELKESGHIRDFSRPDNYSREHHFKRESGFRDYSKDNLDSKLQHFKPQKDAKSPKSEKSERIKFSKNTASDGKIKRISNPSERGNLSFHRDLRDGVIANREIQKQSLNPHFKLDLNTKARVRITPLGGLGEIGGNMTVFETDNSAIVVDIGMSFPDDNTHGVDILIPDFTYIEQIRHKVAAVIITHAHEDHIGATPYFYKHFSFPLYGTPLVLGLVGNKFDEHGLKKSKELFRIVEKRTPVQIGEFEIEWIHITHSIIDSSALAIKTEAGVILHTGDFKIDHTPIDNLPTDLHRLAYYGERGVLLMMSDSTNSHRPGTTASEASVGPTFDSLFKDAKGRVIMSTFSSNIHRVYQAIQYGIQYGRKVAVIGRSMEKNIDIARELEYIDIPSANFIEAHEVNSHDDSEVLIVTTGSQGETMSALYRMATDEHRHVKIKHSDTIILSAKAIPGNEGSVSSVINLIMKAGAKVAYQDFSEIHVSGHAAREEQKLMLRLIKPKFFLPVHGEYNHISKHKETAISCGVLEKNILLMEDGDQIEVNPNYLRKVKSVRAGKVFIDNQVNKVVENEVVAQRDLMANNGIVIVALKFNYASYKIIELRMNTFGILNKPEEREFYKSLTDEIKLKIESLKQNKSQKTLDQELYSLLRKSMLKKFKKTPMIIVNVFKDERAISKDYKEHKDAIEKEIKSYKKAKQEKVEDIDIEEQNKDDAVVDSVDNFFDWSKS